MVVQMTLAWQIVGLIFLSGIIGAWGMRSWLIVQGYVETKYIARRRKQWENERYEQQKRRTRWIHKWASDQMDTVPSDKLRTMDRKILVSYEDLLKVWDISDKIEEYL